MQDFIRINQNDKVAVALKPLAAGLALFIDQKELILTEEIPQGHKFALCAIKKDEPVIKYGFRIGYAKEDIAPGAWVHVHNLRTALGDVLEYKYEPELCPLKKTEPAAFMGYKRADEKPACATKYGFCLQSAASIPWQSPSKQPQRPAFP